MAELQACRAADGNSRPKVKPRWAGATAAESTSMPCLPLYPGGREQPVDRREPGWVRVTDNKIYI